MQRVRIELDNKHTESSKIKEPRLSAQLCGHRWMRPSYFYFLQQQNLSSITFAIDKSVSGHMPIQFFQRNSALGECTKWCLPIVCSLHRELDFLLPGCNVRILLHSDRLRGLRESLHFTNKIYTIISLRTPVTARIVYFGQVRHAVLL